jgi:hypothetical protein
MKFLFTSSKLDQNLHLLRAIPQVLTKKRLELFSQKILVVIHQLCGTKNRNKIFVLIDYQEKRGKLFQMDVLLV